MSKLKQKIITRAQAKEQGLKFYFTGKPCDKNGHLSNRYTSVGNCVDCVAKRFIENKTELSERNKQYVTKNKEKVSEKRKEWYAKHREERLDYYKKWTAENKAKTSDKQREWRLANPEKKKQNDLLWRQTNSDKKKQNDKNWKELNRGLVRAYAKGQKMRRINRIPPWLTEHDKKAIKDMYELAVRKEKETGIKWHVDHIIPLLGENVSGLHVPQNLQVIPASENLQKSNKWEITNEI
jgi:hypothetical protein